MRREVTSLELADLIAHWMDQQVAKFKLPERLEIVDELPPDRSLNAVVLPHWTVGHVVEVPGGAFPSYAQGYYTRNTGFYKQWDAVSRERDTFMTWMKENVLAKGPEAFAEHARKLSAAAE